MNTTTGISAAGVATIIVWMWNWFAPRIGGPEMPAEVATQIGVLVLAIGSRFVDGAR